MFTQVNVVVGAFFVLSGYMAGYTGSVIGKQEADPRLTPTSTYVIAKVMGYYPLHLLVLLMSRRSQLTARPNRDRHDGDQKLFPPQQTRQKVVLQSAPPVQRSKFVPNPHFC